MYPSASPPSFRISHEGIRAEWHNGECHFRKAGGCPPCNTITPVPNIPYPDIDCKHNFPVPASIFHSSLNTDLQNTVVRKLFFEYPPTLNLDDIVKDIFFKIPPGNETYIVNVTAGGSIKMIVQSYGIWEFASAIVFSYVFPGIIFYRKVSGIIFKNVADWTETIV